MSTEPPPPTDWSRFEWKPSSDEPAAGEAFEAFVHRFCHGDQVLSVAADLVLAHPASPTAFATRLRQAWLAVRFAVPTIAAQTVDDRMVYRTAANSQNAQAWAERTVRAVHDMTDLDELRFVLSTRPIPEANGDQTALYYIARADRDYAVALHTSHVPFDGSGAKIVLGRVLAKLAAYLADPGLAGSEVAGLAWGTEACNLTPACLFLVGARDPLDGPLADGTLDDIMARLATSGQCSRGLKMRQVGPGPTRRGGYVFSEEESTRLFAACRQHRFTVNHVLQAALTLVTWLDNPPASPRTHEVYSTLGLVQGRPRLAPRWCNAGKDGYVGYCLGVGVTQVPVDAVTAAIAHGEQHALLQVARIVRAEYAHADAYTGFLTVGPRQVHIVLDAPQNGRAPPPSTSPWYAGDGVERYLAPEYRDVTGAFAIEVPGFMLALNKNDPGPFFAPGDGAGG